MNRLFTIFLSIENYVLSFDDSAPFKQNKSETRPDESMGVQRPS